MIRFGLLVMTQSCTTVEISEKARVASRPVYVCRCVCTYIGELAAGTRLYITALRLVETRLPRRPIMDTRTQTHGNSPRCNPSEVCTWKPVGRTSGNCSVGYGLKIGGIEGAGATELVIRPQWFEQRGWMLPLCSSQSLLGHRGYIDKFAFDLPTCWF